MGSPPHGKIPVQAKSPLMLEESHLMVILKGRIKKLATKMVITSGNEEDKGSQEKESKEETILAMLGIIGTILNLIVIIFVYIYTTL
ncbi:protein TUNAR [Ammospiza nelsoni]|nr:protein TUNAR [Ammospiza caudacuta]XP_059330891.1 protein TUNAR [Ammospiza nelsoni]